MDNMKLNAMKIAPLIRTERLMQRSCSQSEIMGPSLR